MMVCEFSEPILIIHRNAENVAREPLSYLKNSRGYTTPLGWDPARNIREAGGLVGGVFGSRRERTTIYLRSIRYQKEKAVDEGKGEAVRIRHFCRNCRDHTVPAYESEW